MIVYDMPEVEYHARPELSSTGARLLLPEYKGSPRKFQWEQSHPRQSDAFDVGSAVHAKVLGVGQGVVTYPPEFVTPAGAPSKSKAALDWVAEQRDAGFAVVAPNVLEELDAISEAVLAHPTARALLEVAADREVTVFGTVDDVPCRARFDALSGVTPSGVIGVDLKTTRDATKAGFERAVAAYGYDVQAAFYMDVYAASEGRPVDTFAFIVVEKAGPFEVAVYQLPDVWLEIGRAKAAEARRIYRECVESGVWPGYSEEVQFLDPPGWLIWDHETRFEEIEV